MGHVIRPPSIEELPLLAAIERRAAQRFRDVGMAHVAELPPLPLTELHLAFHESRLIVITATAHDDTPAGFALTSLLDGSVHLEELDVDPEHQRRGLGRALLERVCERAGSRGARAVTLHTFRHVPWNMPFYASAGFVPIERHVMGAELRDKTDLDAARLGAGERVCMRRLTAPSPK